MEVKFLADRPDAIPILARWYFEQWGHEEPGNSFELTCERLNCKLNRNVAPIPIIACDTDGTVIGAAQLKLREMDIFPEREYWIGGVYVDASVRGQGIAAALVAKLIEFAKNLCIKELLLQTKALDGGLYRRLGWSVVETLDYKGYRIAIMVKRVGVS